MAVGIFTAISEFRKPLLRKILLALSLIECLGATYRIMDLTVMHTDKARIRLYQTMHYTRDYDVKKAHRALALIPGEAIVSAQSPFLPHLALRDQVYQFPVVKDAEFVVFSVLEDPYPLAAEAFNTEVANLKASTQWDLVYGEDGFYILRRSHSSPDH